MAKIDAICVWSYWHIGILYIYIYMSISYHQYYVGLCLAIPTWGSIITMISSHTQIGCTEDRAVAVWGNGTYPQTGSFDILRWKNMINHEIVMYPCASHISRHRLEAKSKKLGGTVMGASCNVFFGQQTNSQNQAGWRNSQLINIFQRGWNHQPAGLMHFAKISPAKYSEYD